MKAIFRYFKEQKKPLAFAGLGLSLSLFGLTGCSDLNSHFSCPMQPGVRCQSLDQVNQWVDEGNITDEEQRPSARSHASPRVNSPATRVWIAPSQDEQGNTYSARMVYPHETSSQSQNDEFLAEPVSDAVQHD